MQGESGRSGRPVVRCSDLRCTFGGWAWLDPAPARVSAGCPCHGRVALVKPADYVARHARVVHAVPGVDLLLVRIGSGSGGARSGPAEGPPGSGPWHRRDRLPV